jgi:4-amino-4-deoxy-L-arabinose transferase-like glycosyltransferase
VQVFLDALSCLLVFVLARRLFGMRSAVIASVLAVLSLTQIYASGLLLAEALSMFLMLVIALTLHTGLVRPSWLALAAVGVLLGAGVLVKGTFLACLGVTPLLIAWAWWGRWRQAAVAMVLVVGLAAAVLAPWTVRNYRVHGRFVAVSTQVGFNIYCGLNPRNGYIFGWCYGPEISAVKDALPEAEASAEFLRRGVEKVKQNPGMIPGNVGLKILYFFSPVDWEFLPGSEKGGGVLNATYVFMAPFAAWGLIRARRRGWSALMPAAFVLAMLGAVILTESAPRYRFPAEPFIAIYAGVGLTALSELTSVARRVAVAAVAAHATLAVLVFVLGDYLRLLARSVLRVAGLG